MDLEFKVPGTGHVPRVDPGLLHQVRPGLREGVRRRQGPPVEAFREMGQIGWLGINTPLEYGGSAGSTLDMAILLEEIGRHPDLALWTFRVVSHGSHAMQAHGTTEQKDRFLPQIARGELSPAFALSEPEAGSDAASLTTAATAVDGGFRVSGQKIYCSGFKVSDYVLTATRTSSPQRKHEGITTLFIPSNSPGLTATDPDPRSLASRYGRAVPR